MPVGELPKIIGDVQFRLLNGNSNIVDDKNSNPIDSGCLRYEKNAGSKWEGSIASSFRCCSNCKKRYCTP